MVHLSDVLPTYVELRDELRNSRNRLSNIFGPNRDPYGLLNALAEGKSKLEQYFDLAKKSDLALIASSERHILLIKIRYCH